MNKTEIIREVYERLDKKIPMKKLEISLDSILEIMSERLKKGEEIQLAEFGTFSLAERTIIPITKTHTSKSK